jgi:hypothetical protein
MTSLLSPNVKVHLALGFIDMRKRIDGPSEAWSLALEGQPFLTNGQTLSLSGRNAWSAGITSRSL